MLEAHTPGALPEAWEPGTGCLQASRGVTKQPVVGSQLQTFWTTGLIGPQLYLRDHHELKNGLASLSQGSRYFWFTSPCLQNPSRIFPALPISLPSELLERMSIQCSVTQDLRHFLGPVSRENSAWVGRLAVSETKPEKTSPMAEIPHCFSDVSVLKRVLSVCCLLRGLIK